MFLKGVLVQPLAKQNDRSDTGPLDPAKVQFEEADRFPVLEGFDPGRLLGEARLLRGPEGEIIAEIEIDPTQAPKIDGYKPPFYAVWGGIGTLDHLSYRTTSIGIVKDPADENQPPLDVWPDR